MKIATFNVLADAYTGYGDYSHVDPKLLALGARQNLIVQQVNSLEADVVGLQEVDKNLLEAFEDDDRWQTLWSPKGLKKPDGCLTLVKSTVAIANHESYLYDDDSGHVFQITQIGQVAVINTHIKWAPAEDPHHIGVSQTRQMLLTIGTSQPAVILADCNDRPGGPVRALVEQAGFTNVSGDMPTAIVNQEPVALDLLAVRGLNARQVAAYYDLATIPNEYCASDHIPVVANLDI
jgi:endonuclease/exonuclease/phosphatase family metal-dependent hydrolase